MQNDNDFQEKSKFEKLQEEVGLMLIAIYDLPERDLDPIARKAASRLLKNPHSSPQEVIQGVLLAHFRHKHTNYDKKVLRIRRRETRKGIYMGNLASRRRHDKLRKRYDAIAYQKIEQIQRKEVSKMVTETSREAFYGLKDLGHRQSEVYQTIKQLGEACNLDIASTLRMPINSITPRTNELVQKGYVEKSHVAPNRITGKKVIFWKIKS